LVVNQRTDLSRGANGDVVATDLRRKGESITRIVNSYNQMNTHSGERPARKLNWQRLIRQGSTVVAGDFNPDSIPWDPRCQVQRDAAFWEDVTDEKGLEIGNDGEAHHHWTREGDEGESVINLPLENRQITNWSILANDDHATGSDDEDIEWDICNNSSFGLKHPRVPDGFDRSGGTSYPVTEDRTRPVPQVTGGVAYLPCGGYYTMALILARRRVVYYACRSGVRLPVLCVRNVVTYTHHQNNTYVTVFAGVAVMQ
jgi:hypothetical protein